jgi:hypothetical protein
MCRDEKGSQIDEAEQAQDHEPCQPVAVRRRSFRRGVRMRHAEGLQQAIKKVMLHQFQNRADLPDGGSGPRRAGRSA